MHATYPVIVNDLVVLLLEVMACLQIEVVLIICSVSSSGCWWQQGMVEALLHHVPLALIPGA